MPVVKRLLYRCNSVNDVSNKRNPEKSSLKNTGTESSATFAESSFPAKVGVAQHKIPAIARISDVNTEFGVRFFILQTGKNTIICELRDAIPFSTRSFDCIILTQFINYD